MRVDMRTLSVTRRHYKSTIPSEIAIFASGIRFVSSLVYGKTSTRIGASINKRR
ncbi:MAG: hypothetical protein QME63_04450 [Actinomycetota bacterium]|nr:hypothetical protein [Actinomycetota bacterium]